LLSKNSVHPLSREVSYKEVLVKRALFFILTTLLCGSLAFAEEWRPAPGLEQIPLWPAGKIPDVMAIHGPENDLSEVTDKLVAGEPWLWVENVANPTMTVYPAKGVNTGAAVMVFPGGGYWGLAIDLEGTEICDWLTSRGVTCILLKYRVPGGYPDSPRAGPYPRSPVALQDAQRAMGMVRSRAPEWGIDPNKIGVIGFSAGGHLVTATSTYLERVYERVDEIDKVSCRPDFAIAVYPGHLSYVDESPLKLRPPMRVTKNTPPTFLLHAQDDEVDPVEYSLAYYLALREAGVPVEMHLYPEGGHAFGLRPDQAAITTEWPRLVERWLRTIHIIEDVEPEAFSLIDLMRSWARTLIQVFTESSDFGKISR